MKITILISALYKYYYYYYYYYYYFYYYYYQRQMTMTALKNAGDSKGYISEQTSSKKL